MNRLAFIPVPAGSIDNCQKNRKINYYHEILANIEHWLYLDSLNEIDHTIEQSTVHSVITYY